MPESCHIRVQGSAYICPSVPPTHGTWTTSQFLHQSPCAQTPVTAPRTDVSYFVITVK